MNVYQLLNREVTALAESLAVRRLWFVIKFSLCCRESGERAETTATSASRGPR